MSENNYALEKMAETLIQRDGVSLTDTLVTLDSEHLGDGNEVLANFAIDLEIRYSDEFPEFSNWADLADEIGTYL